MKELMAFLWMLVFPLSYIYMIIWGMWWPRHNIEHGRVFAMALTIYVPWMIYATFGSDMLNHIQRTF